MTQTKDENPDWNEIEFGPRKGGRLLERRRAYDKAEREDEYDTV